MSRLTPLAALVILIIWAVSALDGIVLHDYEALQFVTPIMLILAGALFGVEVVRRNGRKRNGTDEEA